MTIIDGSPATPPPGTGTSAVPAATVNIELVELVAGDSYVGRGYSIELSSDQDLSGKNLVIAADRDDLMRFQIKTAILGPQGSHYASFEPDGSVTTQWYPALYDGVLRIEHEPGREETIWTGPLKVTAFPSPTL